MVTVVIRGLEFRSHHGVTDAEQNEARLYRADVELELDTRSIQTDDVAHTADYDEVAETIVRIASAMRYRTVERLAHAAAEAILAGQPTVDKVTLELRKAPPPTRQHVAEAGVRVVLERP
jgi:dihydroneopterin aldolase